MREQRRRDLEQLRRRQAQEEAALTPTERFEKLERLRAWAQALGAPSTSRTDESAEFCVQQRRSRLARFGPSKA